MWAYRKFLDAHIDCYSDPVDAVHNPFEPGAGRSPAALVGRDDAIGQWQANLQRIEAGRSGRPVVLYGLRGVGKTVLLSRLAREAGEPSAAHWGSSSTPFVKSFLVMRARVPSARALMTF